jgi:catechol-2,3-dioxygenase
MTNLLPSRVVRDAANGLTTGMAAVRRLNHAVLYVRDIPTSVAFYTNVLGMEVVTRMGDQAAFLRASGHSNHHDLGMFAVGPQAPNPSRGSVGLYHLAWQVDTIEELVSLRAALVEVGSLVGESSHGVSYSLYAHDPSGNEFEVMWALPQADWGIYATDAVVERLDLPAAVARYGGVHTITEDTVTVS